MIETSWKWASLGLNQGPPDYESVCQASKILRILDV